MRFSALLLSLMIIGGRATASPQTLPVSQPTESTYELFSPDKFDEEIEAVAASGGLKPRREWTKPFNNAAADSDDVAYESALDAEGNFYLTGFSFNAAGNADILTVKYNNDGVRQWTARYNGPAADADRAYAIAVDASGNVFVAGASVNASGDSDAVIIKYDAAGVRQWVNRYDGIGHGHDVAYDLQLDTSGNVYVGGFTRVDATLFDMLTIKYDSNGVQQWLASHHGVGSTSAAVYELAVDAAQNVYVTGYSNGPTGNWDFVTIKYDNNGGELWAALYNPPADSTDFSTDIALDDAGNVFVTGVSTNASDNFDYATVKYDNFGVKQWVARYDGQSHGADRANDVAVDVDGNVYVTGSSYSFGGQEDFATIKYDNLGVKQWVARFNGPANGNDGGQRVLVDLGGNVYVAGYTTRPGKGLDFAVVGYDNSGTRLWVVRHNGSGNDEDILCDAVLDHLRRFYLAGTITNAKGNRDMVAIKFATLPKNVCTTSAKLFAVEAQGGTSSQVFRYDVTPSRVPVLDLTLTHPSFDQPLGVAFSNEHEMFVVNRSTGNSGSVSRFFDALGTPLFNGAMTSMAFNSPHGAVFHNGELFVAQNTGGNVLRFKFGIIGEAVANGEITSGLNSNAPRGLAISPWGELFATQCCVVNEIRRYTFDVNGNAIDNGVLAGNGLGSPHDLVFSPWGELFVANVDSNTVSRFVFDGAHNATPNGTIFSATLDGPLGLSFSPWGELFVSNHHGVGGISRWAFDAAHQAAANGFFATPTTLGDLEILSSDKMLIVNAGADQQIACSDSVQLGGNPTVLVGAAPFTYQWTPSTGLDNSASANPLASPITNTAYVLKVTDTHGCIAQDTVVVNVNALVAGWSVQHITDVDDVIFGLNQGAQPNPAPRDVEALALSTDERYLYLSYLLTHDKRVVRKINLNETDPANNHAAVAAQLQFPNGTVPVAALATDDRGRVYISLETEIRIYDANLNTLLHTINGFSDCEGIATQRKNGTLAVFATDRADKTLERFELTEGLNEAIIASTKAGLDGDGEIFVPSSITPRGVAVQSNGLIWVADFGANAVIRFYQSGNFRGSTAVPKAYDLALDESRNEVFVSQATDRKIAVLNIWNGQVKHTLTPPGAALNLDLDGELGDGALTGLDVASCQRVFVANRRGRSVLAGDPLDSPFSNIGDNHNVSAADADPVLVATGNVLTKDEPEEGPVATAALSNYELAQNYPNPFNPETKISFALPRETEGEVRLSIFSETGQLVRMLVNRKMRAGRHEVRWNGRNREGQPVAAGVYLYRLIVTRENGEIVFSQTNRMTLLK